MSEERQSLANQLGWCITTIDYLENLIKETMYVVRRYNEMIEEVERNNLADEFLRVLKKDYEELSEAVNQLISHVRNDHISYVEKQKRAIIGRLGELDNLGAGVK